MTFGVKARKGGRQEGYLEFRSGKRIYLNPSELEELQLKIREWQYQAVSKYEDSLVNKEA